MSGVDCRVEKRRVGVRRSNLSGLDYLEVSDDQRTLTVFFLGKAPDEIAKRNVVVEGGRRVRGIKVVWLGITRQDDPELDDYMQVLVDKIGDFSTYTLRLVELDEQGRPADEPLHGLDPRYDRLPFSFKIGCASDLDCAAEDSCPPIERSDPAIDYLAKDYSSFRRLMLDRLSLIAPGWRERNPADIGVALVELLAYVGDSLSYFQDAVATEAYLGTARLRVSVRRHLRLVDYRLHEGCNARAWVCFDTDTDLTIDAEEVLLLAGENDATVEPFEPLGGGQIKLVGEHSKIRFWTWGDRDCCLEPGATAATLRDQWVEPEESEGEGQDRKYLQGETYENGERERRLRLAPGDVLVFEEVLGSRTGVEGDGDRAHRHAVLLTRVTEEVDELYDQPVVEIEWAGADELPFPLCLSSTKPDCTPIEDVSVARGNVVLVEHGRRVDPEELGTAPAVELPGGCDCAGRPGERSVVAGRFESPALARSPVTFSEPLGHIVSATMATVQDPRRALPRVALQGTPATQHQKPEDWSPALDLLGASPVDRKFVVEVDDEEGSHLRFGDGELGQLPSPGEAFVARYRVGNGARGNVGAERISRLVFLGGTVEGGNIAVRNPFPAAGGTDPEPVAEAKLLGPSAFRAELQRAVTASDYARLAERDATRLERAAATLEWTGSWYEARVALDPRGTEEAEAGLLSEVGIQLERYRRIGHDLAVVPASYVSLDLALTVCVLPGFLPAHVELAVLDVLSARRLPDGRLGLFHLDNKSFGREVTLSTIVAVVQAVPGVESVIVTRLHRLDEPPAGELGQGFLRLGPREIARLANDPSFPEQGRLELDVRGGR